MFLTTNDAYIFVLNIKMLKKVKFKMKTEKNI